jgi:hypothetical protein
MPKLSLSIGVMALAAAAVVLPAQAQAEHENRYFGFSTGFPPFPFANPYAYYPPPVVYPPPPRMRQTGPGVYEYEVSPGRWVRVRPGYGYQPPLDPGRVRMQPQDAWNSPGPPPVPKKKPDATDQSEVAIGVPAIPDATDQSEVWIGAPASPDATDQSEVAIGAPATDLAAEQGSASDPVGGISCEAATDIVKSFGFSDVQPTSCSGEVYGFEADRDGSAYSIKLSAADGELTEVRKR